MSPLRSKILLNLLLTLPFTNKLLASLRASKRGHSHSKLLRLALLFATFGGLSQAAPAQAQSTFVWGPGAGQNNWQAGSLTGAPATPYQLDGVTINFQWSGATTTFLGGQPALSSDPGGSLAITGTEVTGGLADDNLLVIFNPTTFAETVDLQATFTNAAGNPVPLDNLQYTIVDIDRDNGRVWQDVISTTGSLGGGIVTPTVVPGTQGETVQVISGDSDAIAYTEPAGAITFRGITDPNAASEPQDGDASAVPPIADDSSVEANNQNDEGNVTITHPTAVDQIDIIYGNGTPFAVNGTSGNGLGFDLNDTTDPGAHGAGFLGDFSFFPGIIGVAKSATPPVPDLDPARSGNFLTTFTVTVENLGGVDLNSVQVTDDLSATFPGGFVVTAPPTVITSTGATTTVVGNAGFDGSADQNLLTGGAGSVLDEDDGAGGNGSATITFTISFNPAGATSFSNQATASGLTPGGGQTTDLSDDGTDVDPNDNNDPTDPGEQDPTPITIAPNPQIGVTKQVTSVVNNGNGTYTVTYRHIVRNIGTEDLTGVALTDQDAASTFRVGAGNGATSAVFDPGSVTAISTVPAGFPAAGFTPLTPDPTFDAAGNLQLATVPTLPVGGYGVVEYNVIVDPTDPLAPGTLNLGDGATGTPTNDDPPYESQITATGTGATSGTAVTDLSDDVSNFPGAPLPPADQLPRDLPGSATPGTATDPSTGGVPQSSPIPADDPNAATDENNRTPIVLPSEPQIGVTRRIESIVENPDGTFTVIYRNIVSNLGSEPLSNVTLNDPAAASTFRVGTPDGVTSATFVPGSVDAPAAAPAGFPTTGFTPLTGTPSFDAAGNLQLATTPTLPVGGFGIVDYQVVIDPTDPDNPAGINLGDGVVGGAPGNDDVPFESQTTATAVGASSGTPVTDLSDDATDLPGSPVAPAQQLPADQNGNGTATDTVDATGAPVPNPTPANDPQFATNENNITGLTLVSGPQIGVTKQVQTVTENPDGTFAITYRQIVRNLGSEPISGVALSETQTIDQTFREGLPNGVTSSEFVPGSLAVPGTAPAGLPTTDYVALTPDATFDGAGNLQLATLPTLPVGGFGVVDYQVVVDPTDPDNPAGVNLGDGVAGGAPGDDDPAFDAQAQVTGTGATSGSPVSDISDDVTNFPAAQPLAQLPQDLNGNRTATDGTAGPGTPGGPENDPTSLVLAPQPEIGVTKQVTNIVDNGDGSFDVVFEYVVQNTGQVPLNGVTILDNYDDQFQPNNTGPVTNYEVISVTPGASTASAPLAGEPGAPGQTPGSGLIPLASGTTTVYQPGEQSTAQVVVRVFNPDLSATYDANAVARGTSAADGTTVAEDLSDSLPQFGAAGPQDGVFGPGSDPANPTDPTDPANTPTSVVFSPLQLFKRITSVTRSGVITPFTTVSGTVPDASFVGESDIRTVGDLQSGDSVEYTIYYFNASADTINNVELCDPVPSPLTIVNGSLTATPAAAGTVLSPLTPLSSASNPGRSCGASSGTQGAAVFSVGNIAPATGGFVRFTSVIP